jgi:Mor family transcriptional regulator
LLSEFDEILINKMGAMSSLDKKKEWNSFFKGDIDPNNIPAKELIISLLLEKSHINDKRRVRKEIEAKTEKFINEAKEVWTEEEFNYSHTVFYGRGIILIHKDFGPAWQRPEAHLKKVFPYGNKAFPLKKEKEIVQLNKDGENTIELAKKFGTSDVTISNILKRHNQKPRGSKIVTDEIEELIFSMWDKGEVLTEIKDATKLSKGTIYNVLDKHSRPRKGQRHAKERLNRRIIPPEIEKELVKEYKSDEQPTAASLAKEYNYSDDLVLDCLKRNKVEIRANCKVSDAEFEKIVERYKSGESSCKLSKEFGITPTSITSRLHRKEYDVRESRDYKNTVSEQNIPKILELYSVANLGSSSIANLLGYGKKQVLDVLNANEIKTDRPPSFYSRYNSDSERKLIKSLRSGLEKLYKNSRKNNDNISLTKKARECVGCSPSDLLKHLEETKPKCDKDTTLNLDHIIPISAFGKFINDEEKLNVSCHYQNLQLLTKKDNEGKNDSMEIGLEMLMKKEVKDEGVYALLIEIAEEEIKNKNKMISEILDS